MARVQVDIAPLRGGIFKWIALGAATLLGLILVYGMFTTYVGPDELAVRQVYLGPGKGIREGAYGPGLHFVVSGYERLHIFPRQMQLLDFTDSEVTSEGGHRAPAIRIQTNEGYQVSVDVTIAYRIVDPWALMAGPAKVGPGTLYETALMVPRSDKYLRQKLGELNAEEFYQGVKRRHAAEEVRRILTADVEAAGIQVWKVMVRHYRYDERYQNAIEQRKIQDQTVFKNRAEAIAAGSEAEKNRVLAAGQAAVLVEKQRGQAEVTKIEAEADLYYRQTVAEGDLLVALAEAEGTRLENQALQAAGASNMVGLEMAKVLAGSKVIVVPTDGSNGVNPLDLDALMRGW